MHTFFVIATKYHTILLNYLLYQTSLGFNNAFNYVKDESTCIVINYLCVIMHEVDSGTLLYITRPLQQQVLAHAHVLTPLP